MAYLGVAKSIVEQGKLRVPTGDWDSRDSTSALSLWPPGYPAAVALPTALGLTPIQGARWVNIVAAAITAAAIVAAARPGTWRDNVCGSGARRVRDASDIRRSHIDPERAALPRVAAARRPRDGSRARQAAAAWRSLRSGGHGALCRRCSTSGGSVLDTPRSPIRHASEVRSERRWWRSLPAIAIAIWFTRTALAPDRHHTPQLALYGNWSVTALQARDTLAEWLVPLVADGTVQRVIAVVLGIIIALFVITAARDTARDRLRGDRAGAVATIIGASALLTAWYLSVLAISRAFVGGTIPFDWRILSPAILLIEIMLVTAVGYWWRAYHAPMRIAIAVVALVWIAAAATATVNDAVYTTTEGSDFAGSQWRSSPLIAWVRANGRGHELYSNWPPALYFHAGRIARELPDSTDAEDMRGFADLIRRNHGYVVGFDERSPDFIAPTSLAARLGLTQIVRTSDGGIWEAPAAAPADTTVTVPGADSLRRSGRR